MLKMTLFSLQCFAACLVFIYTALVDSTSVEALKLRVYMKADTGSGAMPNIRDLKRGAIDKFEGRPKVVPKPVKGYLYREKDGPDDSTWMLVDDSTWWTLDLVKYKVDKEGGSDYILDAEKSIQTKTVSDMNYLQNSGNWLKVPGIRVLQYAYYEKVDDERDEKSIWKLDVYQTKQNGVELLCTDNCASAAAKTSAQLGDLQDITKWRKLTDQERLVVLEKNELPEVDQLGTVPPVPEPVAGNYYRKLSDGSTWMLAHSDDTYRNLSLVKYGKNNIGVMDYMLNPETGSIQWDPVHDKSNLKNAEIWKFEGKIPRLAYYEKIVTSIYSESLSGSKSLWRVIQHELPINNNVQLTCIHNCLVMEVGKSLDDLPIKHLQDSGKDESSSMMWRKLTAEQEQKALAESEQIATGYSAPVQVPAKQVQVPARQVQVSIKEKEEIDPVTQPQVATPRRGGQPKQKGNKKSRTRRLFPSIEYIMAVAALAFTPSD